MLKAGDAMVKTLKGIRSREDKKTRQISSCAKICAMDMLRGTLGVYQPNPAGPRKASCSESSIGVDQAKGVGVGRVK